MAPIDPQETPQEATTEAPRALLVVFGLAALALAGALLFYAYGRFNADEASPLESIPAFSATAESGVAPLVTDLDGLPQAGSAAPDFELTDVNGETVRLGDYGGRPVILNFWATWCAPCRVEMPELQRAQTEFDAEPNGPVVLTVNQQESAELVTEFFDEVGLTLPALLDSDGDVGGDYGAIFLPTSVIVGPDGVVVAVHRGMISRDELDSYLSTVAPVEGS